MTNFAFADKSGRSVMKKCVVVICCICCSAASFAVIDQWYWLVRAIDSRTIVIGALGKEKTLSLAGVGKAVDEKKTIKFIEDALTNQGLNYYPIFAKDVEMLPWDRLPMCIFFKIEQARREGSPMGDKYMLNAQMLELGLVDFDERAITEDPYGLNKRLVEAARRGKKKLAEQTNAPLTEMR